MGLFAQLGLALFICQEIFYFWPLSYETASSSRQKGTVLVSFFRTTVLPNFKSCIMYPTDHVSFCAEKPSSMFEQDHRPESVRHKIRILHQIHIKDYIVYIQSIFYFSPVTQIVIIFFSN